MIRDARGSSHVVETLIVAGFVVAGVAAVTQMQARTVGPEETSAAASQELTKSAIDMLTSRPVLTDTARYSHALESWHVAEARTGDSGMDRWMYRGVGSMHHQSTLNIEGNPVSQMGEQPGKGYPTTAASKPYVVDWGTTSITPAMSHVNPGQPMRFDVHPLRGSDVMRSGGYPFEATATLVQGDASLQASTHDTLYAPAERPARTAALSVHDSDLVLAPTINIDPLNTTWPLVLRIQPAEAGGEVYIRGTTVVRVELPSPWTLQDVPKDWRLLSEDDDPATLFQYRGVPKQGGEIWLHANFTWDSLLPLPTQTMRVELQELPGSAVHQVRIPAPSDRYEGPVVTVDQVGPLSTDHARALEVRVTNPDDTEVEWTDLRLAMDPDLALVFEQYLTKGHVTGAEQVKVRFDGKHVVFTWQSSGNMNISPGASAALQIPLLADTTDQNIIRPRPEITLTHERPDGSSEQLRAQRGAHVGGYQLTVPGSVDLGSHTMRVLPDADAVLPPGLRTYEVLPEPIAALDDIQDARRTMRLDVSPRVAAVDEPLLASLDLGTLPETLQDLETVDPDGLKIRVRGGDMWSILTDQPLVDWEAPLKLDPKPAVVGMEFVELDGDQSNDLVVAYSDGHIVALRGSALDDPQGYREAVWRTDLRGQITTGPVVVDVLGDRTPEIVLGMRAVGQDPAVVVLDSAGAVVLRIKTQGVVEQMVPWQCNGHDRGVAWLGIHFADRDQTYAPLPGQPNIITHGGDPRNVAQVVVQAWTPGQNIVAGPQHNNVDAVKLRAGTFAPWGTCGFVYGLTDGTLVRLDADGDSLDLAWEVQDVPLQELWVANVTHTTVDRIVNVDGDDIIVFDETGRWRVLAAWAPSLSGSKVEIPLPDPTDRLVRLSWVNPEVGWLVSEKGWLYRTTDGGESFTFMSKEPLATSDKTILDMVFGSEGTGIAVRSDDLPVLIEEDGSFTTKERKMEKFVKTYQLVEWGPNPSLIGQSGVEGVVHADWPYGANEFAQVTQLFSCNCKSVQGTPERPVGMDDSNLTHTPHGVLGEQNGVIALDSGVEGTRLWRANNMTALDWDGEEYRQITHGFASLKTDRTEGVPLAFSGTTLLVEQHEDLVLHDIGEPMVSIASGPGKRLAVSEDSVHTLQSASSHLFKIHGASEGESLQLKLSSTPPKNGISWRLVAPQGLTKWTDSNVPLINPGDGTVLLEVRFLNQRLQNSFASVAPALSRISNGEVARVNEESCDFCLRHVAPDQGATTRPDIWLDPDGVLPAGIHAALDWPPMLVDTENGVAILGESATGIYLRNLGNGSRDEGPANDVSDPLRKVQAGGASLDHIGVRAWWTHRTLSHVGQLNPQLARANNDDDSRLFVWNPMVPKEICQHSGAVVQNAEIRVVRIDGDRVVFGFEDGRIGHMSGCSWAWDAGALDTGARFSFALPRPDRDLIGPYRVQVDVQLDVLGLENLNLSLTDVVVLSRDDEPERVVVGQVELLVFDGRAFRPGSF